MVLERSATAYGRCRETGAETWFLERSVTAYGQCRETAASSWNGLSRPRNCVGRLGQKHGLGMFFYGLWAV